MNASVQIRHPGRKLLFVKRSIENMTDEELVGIHAQIQKQIGELNLSLQPVEEDDKFI